jgi:hypothetical protein
MKIPHLASNVEGRARHSVRAEVGWIQDGAHGVTRPTIGCWMFPHL